MKIIVLSCLVAAALARPDGGYGAPAPSYQPAKPHHGGGGYGGAHHGGKGRLGGSHGNSAGGYGGHHQQYENTNPKYNYEYKVADDYYGANFGHAEARDGYATQGSYYVHLPDGRIQTVTYTADQHGYHPQVSYEGEAKFDGPSGGYKQPHHQPAHHGGAALPHHGAGGYKQPARGYKQPSAGYH